MTDLYFSIVYSPFLWIGALLLAVLIVLSSIKPPAGNYSNSTEFGTLIRRHYWRVMVIGGLGLGVAAICFYLVDVGLSVRSLVSQLEILANAEDFDAEDARNTAQAVALLLAALAASATLIFQLVRVWTTERTTTATEEGLTTDRINKAVAGLGAEKEVSRIGRALTFERTTKDKIASALMHEEQTRTVIEWQSEHAPRKADEKVTNRGDWKVFTETVPNLEVRIGAIYALERISQDSPRDHIQIMEILCAYIHENAPADKTQALPEAPWDPKSETDEPLKGAAIEGAGGQRFVVHRVASKAWRRAQSLNPRTDVQIAFDVIGRRDEAQFARERGEKRQGGHGYRLDLRDVNLRGVDLSQRDLRHAGLSGARMEGADLNGARMEGADLSGAWMKGADLIEARMEGANLFAASMEGANHSGARMRRANLKGAQMEGATLFQARMEEADLSGAWMEGADLIGASTKGADLSGAWMKGADLIGASMEGVDLSGARMEGADLSGARMDGANLFGARMEGANLRGAQMEGADLSGARMEGANLFQARMEGANLFQARMEGANLSGASMLGANLRGASMKGANFRKTRMEGANLFAVSMEGADLSGARMDATTSFNPVALRAAGLKDVDLTDVPVDPDLLREVFGDATVLLPEGVQLHPDSPVDEELDWHEFRERWRAWQVEIGYRQ